MISSFTEAEFSEALRSLPIPPAAVVIVSASFYKLGRLEGARSQEEYIETLGAALRGTFGDSATLVGNTYTTDVGRFGRPFVLEETTCTSGMLNDWLLRQPGRVRSLHPLNSVTALGRRAAEICEGVGRTNYGYNTPYGRMSAMEEAWLLRVGLTPYLNGFDHLAEVLCGVPYLYAKQLDVEVWAGGRRVPGPWLASVRHLHLDVRYDTTRVRRLMEGTGLVHRRTLGAGEITALPARRYFELLSEALSRDPFFLKPEGFVIPRGSIPRDGQTEGRDGVAQRVRPQEPVAA